MENNELFGKIITIEECMNKLENNSNEKIDSSYVELDEISIARTEESDTESDTKSDTKNDTESNIEDDTGNDTKNDTKSTTESDTESDTESNTEEDDTEENDLEKMEEDVENNINDNGQKCGMITGISAIFIIFGSIVFMICLLILAFPPDT